MSEYAIIFCTQLARAAAQGRKTLTYQPLTDDELAIMREDQPLICPYGQPGDTLWVREPWGTAQDQIVYLALCTTDGFRQPIKLPAGYFPGKGLLAREHARLFLDVVAIDIARLQTHTEASAKATVGVVSEGRTSYLDELQTQWATAYSGATSWDANPLCWRIQFQLPR